MGDKGANEYFGEMAEGAEQECFLHRLSRGLVIDSDEDCEKKTCFPSCPLAHRERRHKVQLLESLQSIINIVNKSLAEAENHCKEDAVNWSRAACYNAEVCIAYDGSVTFRVWIGNASPNARTLQRFVYHYLRKHGINAEVHTEW